MSKQPIEIQSPPFNLLAQKITSEGFTRYESRQNWKISSPGKRLSRNLANEEWSDEGSERNSVLENGQKGGDQQKIDFILEKSKARLAERDADHMKSQSYLYEKHIKEALNEYFKPLEEEFMKEDGYKNGEDVMDDDLELTESATEEDKSNHKVSSDDFSKAVKEYILKVSGQKYTESMQDSDNLLCKSLKLADQLSVLSMRPSQGRTEKLKAYIPILASQLSVQNQKYRETRRSIITGQKEKEFLLMHNPDNFNTQEKWYQINKALTESTVVLQINSVKKIRYKYKKTIPSWYCEVKVDGIPNGKSSVVSKTLKPVWNDTFTIKFSNDMLFENISIEIYECTTTPILVGECFITLQELLENTLFNKTFRVKLPIVPIDKVNEYRMASLPSLGDTTTVNNGSLNIMSEQEFREYMQMAMLGGNNIGLLRASFEVNLEPTFVDLVKEIRLQRLENLELWSEENKVQVKEQLELLQSSIAPINTLEIDATMGIKVQDGVKDGGSGRGGCGCGVDTCNIF